MNTPVSRPYSTKTLSYCAGVVLLVYWVPFIYLAVVDPNDLGHGGMVLFWFLPIVVVAVLISAPEVFRAIRQRTDEASKTPTLALSLFGVTVSPLVIFLLGILRNV